MTNTGVPSLRRLYTDQRTDCEVPTDAVSVNSEIEFLHAMAGNEDLVVRGMALCQWVERVWQSRGLPIERLLSPVEELEKCVMGAVPGQLAQLYEERLSSFVNVARPFKLQRVLEALYPEDVMWQNQSSLRHAASWLMWLDRTDPAITVQPLLRTQAMLWRSMNKGVEAVFYEVYEPEKARELLGNWLGYGEEIISEEFPVFPLDVPLRYLDMAARSWKPRIVTTKGEYALDLIKLRLPRCMRMKAAELAYNYFKTNQENLSQDAIRLLANYLTPQSIAVLRKFLPPPTPGMPPRDAVVLRRWFQNDYLPYRMWCLGSQNEEGLKVCEEASIAFAYWYLDFYPKAISVGNQDLAFIRASMLQGSCKDYVTLFVITDGLCELDAHAMIHKIIMCDERLTLSRNDLVFASVPTITEICKPALKMGRTPRDVNDATSPPKNIYYLPENADPSTALEKAIIGDYFIWSHTEPDRTYHGFADTTTLLDKVEGQVKVLASRIVNAADKVPDSLKLRIVVATDHGRLLGKSSRTIKIPEGMKSHQRAALGLSTEGLAQPGYQISEDGSTVLLNGRRFGFSKDQDCAVVLGDKSFFKNDGKSGLEHFPHGGLSPEEVLTPWFEIIRDAEPPSLECIARGAAEEGKPGDISIRCVNFGSIDITILTVEFQFCNKPRLDITFDTVVPRQQEKTVIGRIDVWPTPTDLRAACALARVKLPVGDEQTVPVQLELESEGFQSRRNILDDLL